MLSGVLSFHLKPAMLRSNIKIRKCNVVSKSSSLLAFSIDHISTTFVAVGDYAAEIEGAVGEEIYGPIFKAGIFIFLSGFISAFIAAAIISKSESWEDLSKFVTFNLWLA